jgi:acetyltransferase-like isoleucine patch superfamily enzyme
MIAKGREKLDNDQTPSNPFDLGYFKTDELRSLGFKSVGENVMIAKNATIIGIHNVAIGSNVRIDANVAIIASQGFLRLGSFIHIGGACHLSCGGGVTMEDFSGLSQGVRIYSITDDYSGGSLTNPTVPSKFLNPTIARVRLGRHVIVGSGSVVLPGIDVGEGTAIGALSLVTRSTDEWSIYSGVPATRRKDRSRTLLKMERDLLDGHSTVSD